MRKTPTLRSTLALALGFWLGACLPTGICLGQITRQMNPWGRFEPGAWKLVRVVTETFNEEGTISSVTETKTTLTAVGESDITLMAEVSVEVAGRQFDAEPQEVHQAFNGEPTGEDVKVTDLGESELEIHGRKISCKVQRLESVRDDNKTVTEIHYSDKVVPYILKRHSTTTDAEGKVVSETTVDVFALDVPTRVGRVICMAAHLKAVHKHAKGTSTTLAVTCPEVPGGIICHSLKELDESGRMTRDGSLELLAYGLDPDENDRGGFFRRRRARVNRKNYRYYVPRQP